MATTLQDLNITGLKFYEPSTTTTAKTVNGQSTQELQQNFLKNAHRAAAESGSHEPA